jgi:hypothetical protein
MLVLLAISIIEIILIIKTPKYLILKDDLEQEVYCTHDYEKSFDNGSYDIQYQIYYKGHQIAKNAHDVYSQWYTTTQNKESQK